jgi:hypothetical protein
MHVRTSHVHLVHDRQLCIVLVTRPLEHLLRRRRLLCAELIARKGDNLLMNGRACGMHMAVHTSSRPGDCASKNSCICVKPL